MASIDKRPNGKWRARWREPDGTQRALHFVRKLDAERHLVEVQAAMHRGAYVSPEAGEILLRDYAATWKDGQPWAPSSRARYESILTKHVLPRFGHLPLRAIRTSDVRAWVASMAAEGYAAASIKSHFGVLRAIMRGAIEDQRLATSPCQGVKKLSSPGRWTCAQPSR